MEPATIGRVSSVVGCPESNAPPVQLAGGALKKQPEKIFPELPQENFRECQPLDSVSIFEGQLAQMGDVTGLDATYARDPDFVSRRIADEVIVLPIRKNLGDLESIYTLNEVGARIWELLDGRRTLREIRDVIVGEYQVTDQEATVDLETFVEHLPAIGYSALVERIKRGDGMAHVPLEGSWELTYRCNLTCTHCWVNLPAGDRRARQRELSADEIDRIAGEIVDAGGLWLLLTGGEIFIRPDFLDVYRRLKRRGLLLTLYTNGTMITERAADLLAEYPPSLVEVSLYGITPGTYAAVTEVPALERCLRGIELLRERRIKIRLKSVVTTANYDEFLDIAAWVKREFGQRFRYDPNINFRKIEGSEGMAPARVRVPAARVVALDRALDAETDDLRETYQDMV